MDYYYTQLTAPTLVTSAAPQPAAADIIMKQSQKPTAL